MAARVTVRELLSLACPLLTRRKMRLLACAFSRQVWDLLSQEFREVVEELEDYAEAYPERWALGGNEPPHPHRGRLFRLHEKADQIRMNSALRLDGLPSERAMRAIVGATLGEEYLALMDAQEYALLARSERPEVEIEQREMIDDAVPFTVKRWRATCLQEPVIEHSWLTETVANLAASAYHERNLPNAHLQSDRLLVLADALEDAGCEEPMLLEHLRSTPHVRGCWALDSLLEAMEEERR